MTDDINWVLVPLFSALGLLVGYIARYLFGQKPVREAIARQLSLEAQIQEQHARHIEQLEQVSLELKQEQAKNAELDKAYSVAQTTITHQLSSQSALQTQRDQINDQLTQVSKTLMEREKSESKYAESTQNLQHRSQELLKRIEQNEQELKNLYEENKKLLAKNSELVTTEKASIENHKTQQEHFEQQKKQLSHEFQNLANKIFDQKGKNFSEDNQKNMDLLLKPFREQISEFRLRVDTIHKESNESTISLKSQLDQLKELNQQMTGEAKNLARALKGEKKTVGNWGEMQLERTLQLAGLVKNDHYTREEHFRDELGKSKRPDFVVKLPDGKHIIVDSKVSLNDYERAISSESEHDTGLYLSAHVKAVKKHIDDLTSKDYTNVLGIKSPNFVLMFMPIESAYIEALKHSTELFNYGYDKNVILVSHTTLMPILRTVANLWMIERSNTEAREVANKAGEIFNQVCLLAERIQKMGYGLSTVSKHYNDTLTALVGQQGLYGKVERFTDLSNKVTKSLPEIEEIHLDFETERLELIKLDEAESNTSSDDETPVEEMGSDSEQVVSLSDSSD